MPHAGLARNTAASSLALSPDIVLPAALHFLQLTPTLVHTDGLYLDLASQKSRHFTHRLWGNASAVFRSSDQIAVCDSCPPPPLCIRLTEPSGTQPIYSGCQRSIYIRGRDALMGLGSTASARPIEICG